MKIAIFSDSHDNIPNLEKFLGWTKENKVDQLIFCGDLCAPSVLKKIIAPTFAGKIHMVFGNVTDRELLPQIATEFDNVTHYGNQGELKVDNLILGFTHRSEDAEKMAEAGKYDYVFYGHTHTPWQKTIKNCELVNPGTLAGMFNKATFAVLDTKTKKLDLKILEKL